MGRKSHLYKRINQHNYTYYITYYRIVMLYISFPGFHFCVRMPLRDYSSLNTPITSATEWIALKCSSNGS